MVGIAEDEQLEILAAVRGDLGAFNSLVLRYQDSVYTTAYRLMGDSARAADAAQETMIIAYQRLASYRGGSFRGWLSRIVTNLCYDELRRQRRRPTISLSPEGQEDDIDIPDAGVDSPEEVAQQRELERAIQLCIDRLNLDQRMVLVLCDIDEMDYQTIAITLKTQVGTVKSRLSRARASVRECLKSVRELLPTSYRLLYDDSGTEKT